LEPETLTASSDHISKMFEPAPRNIGKKSHLGKKGQKREDPSPSQRSGTQSASQRSPGMIVFQSPHQSQEAYQKEKGMVKNGIIYLFHCKSGTKPHTLQDVT
jgi:hypothetical protein